LRRRLGDWRYSVDDFGTPAASFTFPGVPTNIGAMHYDAGHNLYIASERLRARRTSPRTTIAAPPVATQRTVPASITGSNAGLSIAQNPATGRLVASWVGQTKVAFSDDGINWTASTTSLTSGSYVVRFGDGVFIAVDTVSPASNYYVSADGDTWTQVGMNEPIADRILVEGLRLSERRIRLGHERSVHLLLRRSRCDVVAPFAFARIGDGLQVGAR